MSDGTAAGTGMLAHLNSGSGGGGRDTSRVIADGSSVFVRNGAGRDDDYVFWITYGTEEGKRVSIEDAPWAAASTISSVIPFGDGLHDSMLGTSEGDVLRGHGGDDSLRDRMEADTLYGDAGNDLLLGSKSDDVLVDGGGRDTSNGDDGADTLNGGDGNDTMRGGNGDDRFFGGADDDVIADHVRQVGLLSSRIVGAFGHEAASSGCPNVLAEVGFPRPAAPELIAFGCVD